MSTQKPFSSRVLGTNTKAEAIPVEEAQIGRSETGMIVLRFPNLATYAMNQQMAADLAKGIMKEIDRGDQPRDGGTNLLQVKWIANTQLSECTVAGDDGRHATFHMHIDKLARLTEAFGAARNEVDRILAEKRGKTFFDPDRDKPSKNN
jgi:hypothetical protein